MEDVSKKLSLFSVLPEMLTSKIEIEFEWCTLSIVKPNLCIVLVYEVMQVIFWLFLYIAVHPTAKLQLTADLVASVGMCIVFYRVPTYDVRKYSVHTQIIFVQIL